MSATSANLSIDEVASLGKLLEHAKSAGEIAKAFAKGRFDSTYLPGTGEELWRQLWEAARSFSFSSAYKGQEFPVTGDGARCVLCQQTLDAPAEERLKEFDEFCKDQSQQLAEQSEEQFTLASGKVKRMMPLSPEYDKVEADFLLASPDELASIVTFVRDADERLATLKDNIEKRLWKEPRVIATLQANRINGIPTQKGAEPSTTASSVADVITALAARLKDRAKKEESADDPQIRKKMEAERDESAAREWLAGVKTYVLAQIGRYKEIAALEACLKDTSTTKITTKNTELTKCLVTDAFCDRFKKEAKELGLRTIGVKLEEIKGKKGETKFGLRLELNADQAVRDIASEGEKRCIALAAFLAELSQASHQSALMFDDPVSSFDHQYRQKTAERLVEKSKVRQVIVFTHDVVFLNDLQAYASDVGVKTAVFHLEWADNKPGQCVVGLPWDWKSAEDRLDKLEKEQRAMAKTWNPIPNEENIKSMRRAYSWLRATLV